MGYLAEGVGVNKGLINIARNLRQSSTEAEKLLDSLGFCVGKMG